MQEHHKVTSTRTTNRNATEKKYTEIADDVNNWTHSSVPVSEKQPYSFVASVLTTLEQQSLIQEAQSQHDVAMMKPKVSRDEN